MKAMKDSGVPWIGEIPTDWTLNRIKNLFFIVSGATPSTDAANWDGDVKWVTPADYKTKDKYISCGKRNLTYIGYRNCSTLLVPTGSLVFSKRAPIGTVAIAAEPLCTNQGCLSCVKKDENIDSEFYYYVLSVGTEHFELMGSGTTFKEISASNFGKCAVPFPNFEMQHRVAAFLDSKCSEINALAADIQKEIDVLERYKRSVITETVTKGLDRNVTMRDSGIEWVGQIPEHWKLCRIKYVAVFKNGDRGSNYPSGNDMVDEGVPFLTSNNIHDLVLDCSEAITKYITEERYALLSGAKINLNDIIYCLRGSVGNCAINKSLTHGTVCSALVDIKPSGIVEDFLNYVLHSAINDIQTQLNMNGSCAANLSAENVANYIFVLPPLSEQREIAEYLNTRCAEVDSIIATKQKQLSVLDSYKKSVIYEYVTGKKEVP